MGLPLYKVLEIYDASAPSLWAKLSNAGVGDAPVVADISKLGDKEEQGLELIEEFLRLNKARAFPYPLYVVSGLDRDSERVEIFSSLQKLPSHYKKKNRPLNMKENTLLAKTDLKQKKLKSVNTEETAPILADYGRKHRMIAKKQSYLNFLADIEAGLGDKR